MLTKPTVISLEFWIAISLLSCIYLHTELLLVYFVHIFNHLAAVQLQKQLLFIHVQSQKNGIECHWCQKAFNLHKTAL